VPAETALRSGRAETVEPPAGGPAARALTERAAPVLRGLGTIAVVLVAWELVCRIGSVDEEVLPTASATLAALGEQLATERFWEQLGVTVLAWALGLLLGGVVGTVLGIAIGLSSFFYRSVALMIEFFKTVPVVAALPLGILLFGATVQMNVSLVALGITWPVMIQAAYGVRSVEPVVRDTGIVYRLSAGRRLAFIVLPSAAPYIATGLRLASTGALLLVVVAQLIGGGGGLGYGIFRAQNASQTPTMYALIVVVGLLGVLITFALTAIERSVLRWHESQREQVS
jgi:ABC-type nitrate/sulfonate/bicarbonate transport system permease component